MTHRSGRGLAVLADVLLSGALALATIGAWVGLCSAAYAGGPENGPGCSGNCIFSNGRCNSNPTTECSGTNCSCPSPASHLSCACT